MARVLVTGMSGAGKTTLLDALSARGWSTVDTDHDGWVLPDGRWDEARMAALLDRERDLVVSGTVENQGRFYDRFEHVVLLSAPLDVLLQRLARRTTNPYGRTPAQRAEVARYLVTVEPLLRAGATLELDGRRSPDELVAAVEGLLRTVGALGQTAAMDEQRAPGSAQEWDERYAGDQVWSGHPNAALVAEVEGLAAGRVLDVGCGEGADSVWLARQGWHVTALDVSANAVERTRAAAVAAGVEVDGVAVGLLDAPLAEASYDLVSAMYPALLRTPTHLAEQRLLDLLAPGGTLLVVHHADIDAEVARSHGCDPDDYVSPGDVRDLAARRDGFELLVDERRERGDVHGGAGAHHTHDLVVRLRRR